MARHAGRSAINEEPGRAGSIAGDADALIATLYDELTIIARRAPYPPGGGQTLQTAALVSEAYLKHNTRNAWENERNFLGCERTAIRPNMPAAPRARMNANPEHQAHPFTEHPR